MLLLVAESQPARAGDNLLTEPGAASRAVADIVAKIGHEPPISLIEIAPDRLRMQVQGDKPRHVNEWRWEPLDLWLFETSVVMGPEPITPSSPVSDVTGSFFPLRAVKLDAVPEIVAASIKRAALEDEARVTELRVERPVLVWPEPHFTEPRFTVSVTSDREHATVYAALDGSITGADLSGTDRARMLNLFADDSHLAEAKADLAAALGDSRLREVSFSEKSISVSAEHPSKKDRLITYRWDLGGVRRDLVDSPDIGSMVDGGKADLAFAFSDLDFAVLPDLKMAAIGKLAMGEARITGLEAKKRATGLRPPELVWIVEVENTQGAEGEVIADAKGTILELVEPEGRQPKQDWLAGATVRATLDRIFAAFPKDGKFKSITIDDERGHVDAEDPLKPGEMASFIVDGSKIERWGTPFPDEVFGMGPPQLFTAEDMAGYDAAMLETLKQRTLDRLRIEGGKVYRLTFERGNVFVASPHGHVLLEVRVEGPRGGGGGRVTYEPDGTELDVVMP
jgi:hypothetical protein